MTETFVNSDGVQLWTVSHGAGVPIVLCNGGPGCCDYLAPVAAILDGMAQVIRFEPRGCGRSDQAPPYTIETCLADLEAIRQQYGIDQWIIAGHSWGADLALTYALHYPERVRGFVCIAGGRVQNDREWHRVYSERRDQGLETLPLFDYPPNLQVNADINQSWKQYIQRPSLLKDLAHLERPALFLYGDQDIRPSWPVEQIAQLLPNASLTMIAGANHYIWVTAGEAMKALLRAFIRQITESVP
jgi:proline iminopeptidase